MIGDLTICFALSGSIFVSFSPLLALPGAVLLKHRAGRSIFNGNSISALPDSMNSDINECRNNSFRQAQNQLGIKSTEKGRPDSAAGRPYFLTAVRRPLGFGFLFFGFKQKFSFYHSAAF
jgi:hypothetical protein